MEKLSLKTFYIIAEIFLKWKLKARHIQKQDVFKVKNVCFFSYKFNVWYTVYVY